jgi:hypothetical protein
MLLSSIVAGTQRLDLSFGFSLEARDLVPCAAHEDDQLVDLDVERGIFPALLAQHHLRQEQGGYR